MQYKSHNWEDALGKNWKNEDDLLGKMITTTTANGTFEILTKDMPWRNLFASEFLLALREEWFSSHEFSAITIISDIKYNHPRLQYKNCFYSFNNQLDYSLAHYFLELKTTKSNIDQFLTNPLMVFLIIKLSYKNADK